MLGRAALLISAAFLLSSCGDGGSDESTASGAAGLPADQREEITRLLVDLETTSDPAHCVDDYTDRLVQAAGGVARCRKLESGAHPDSIEVVNVEGTDHGHATAHLIARGGSFDGDQATAELVYEDGRWKLDRFTVQQDKQTAPAT